MVRIRFPPPKSQRTFSPWCARKPPIWSVSPAEAGAWHSALQIRPRFRGAGYRYGLRRSRRILIAMLRRPEGATVDEVVSATGWQRHTVRGVYRIAEPLSA